MVGAVLVSESFGSLAFATHDQLIALDGYLQILVSHCRKHKTQVQVIVGPTRLKGRRKHPLGLLVPHTRTSLIHVCKPAIKSTPEVFQFIENPCVQHSFSSSLLAVLLQKDSLRE